MIRINYENFSFFATYVSSRNKRYSELRELISTALEISRKDERGSLPPLGSAIPRLALASFYMRYSLLLRIPRNYLNELVDGGGKLGGDSLTLVSRYQSDAERASRRSTNLLE